MFNNQTNIYANFCLIILKCIKYWSNQNRSNKIEQIKKNYLANNKFSNYFHYFVCLYIYKWKKEIKRKNNKNKVNSIKKYFDVCI